MRPARAPARRIASALLSWHNRPFVPGPPVTFTARKASEVDLQRTRRNLAGAAAIAALLAAHSVRAEEPAKIYVAKCQACHGVDGQSPFPDLMLNDDKWIHGNSIANITKVIEEGVPGKAMISFKPQLTKPEIDALAKYVRSLSKRNKGAK